MEHLELINLMWNSPNGIDPMFDSTYTCICTKLPTPIEQHVHINMPVIVKLSSYLAMFLFTHKHIYKCPCVIT